MEYQYLISWFGIMTGSWVIILSLIYLLLYLLFYIKFRYKGSYWNSRSRHLQGNRWMQMLLPYAVLLLFTAVPLLTGINALWYLSAVPITISIIQIIRQHPDFRADGYRYLPVCLPCGILLGILFLTNHILYWS